MSLPLASAPKSAPIPQGVSLLEEIARLKKSLNAVILAHYYQDGEIQDLADFVGDSLQLSQAAAKTQADTIVFCGVHFMAETAKILNPNKAVLIPDLDAGCSLADRCPGDQFAAWLKQYPGHKVVSYINCSAEVKALSDVICTSSNAEKIVRSFPREQPIVFAPDRHLGAWVEKQTGRPLVKWPGFCVVHEQFTGRQLLRLKAQHPSAQIIAHPECEESVLDLADYIGSTRGLLDHVSKNPQQKAFIVATEVGILHLMQKARPDAELIPAPPSSGCNCAICPYMRLNSLEKLYVCMRDRGPSVTLAEDLRLRALKPVQRMLELSA
ncbi:MAG: quinolinate synthase NadA [Deltaproteobacteria bacterium]|nr:quinolinate synthase NadA [Deltaproteobacteria bacterium]